MSPGTGGRSAGERLAVLAGRLTDRDRTLCRLLFEHRVLTTLQLVDLAFPSRNAAEHRLAVLHQLGVVDRFRPRHTPGSAPYHYVLGPLGAALLAAQTNQEPGQFGYRRDRTLALAHSQRLGHLLGVNGFFTALARTARHHPDAALEAWWSEQRCAAQWGRLAHPDGYGRWREHQTRVDFFLEYDRASEPLGRLAAKLPGYHELAHATGIATPLLVWLPTPAREAAARQAMAGSGLPLATATPQPGHTPAGPLWLPLHADGPRRRLAQLATAWRPAPCPPAPARRHRHAAEHRPRRGADAEGGAAPTGRLVRRPSGGHRPSYTGRCAGAAGRTSPPPARECPLTYDFEWAELPDDVAHRKQQAWQEWEATDAQLHDPEHPLDPEEQAELEQRHRAAWKRYWHADGARYHLSNRQVGDAITVMEHAGMARRVTTPPFPRPHDYGASSDEYDQWLDASDRGDLVDPSPELASYLEVLERHQRDNFGAEVIPVHKLWTNDGWLLTPDELAAALQHAPTAAVDRRQRQIPWWQQWLDYLDSGRGHGGIRVR